MLVSPAAALYSMHLTHSHITICFCAQKWSSKHLSSTACHLSSQVLSSHQRYLALLDNNVLFQLLSFLFVCEPSSIISTVVSVFSGGVFLFSCMNLLISAHSSAARLTAVHGCAASGAVSLPRRRRLSVCAVPPAAVPLVQHEGWCLCFWLTFLFWFSVFFRSCSLFPTLFTHIHRILNLTV